MSSEQVNSQENKDRVVENRLKALYNLQKVWSEIDKIRVIRGELPLEVRDMEDEVAGLNIRIEKYDAETARLNREIADHNNQRAEWIASIEKKKLDCNNVQNNREWDAINKEIEYLGLEIQHSDKLVGQAKAQLEAFAQEREKAVEQLAECKRNLEQKKVELDEIITETKSDEERLMNEVKVYSEQIDEPRYLDAFNRIRKNARNGLAVVSVQRGACGGCFNKIPPQRQLDIKLHKKVLVCEYCGRILVDEDIMNEPQAE